MMRIGIIRHIGLIKIGLIGLIGPILLSGCVHLLVKPYGYVTEDVERVRPDRMPVYMPFNAPSISQGYKPKRLKSTGSGGHNGIDIIDESGAPVISAAPGVVIRSYFEFLFGNCIEISHGVDESGLPVITKYVHLRERMVSKGDVVVRGQQIGELGRTGLLAGGILHLHYEVRVGSGKNNSRNPHRFWADGVGVVTCFDRNKQWHDIPFNTTYPVPCTGIDWK